MRKKRLIFTLLYNDGYFMLSRNFRLQKVGDVSWIENNYNFENIAFSIDELVILDVTRQGRDIMKFCTTLSRLIANVFVPVSVGGGIKNFEAAKTLFMSGADKIVINSALTTNPELVRELVKEYGSQAVIASIDYKFENERILAFRENGADIIPMGFLDYIDYIHDLGVGEVYLNSILKDGTGQGYSIDMIQPYLSYFKTPVILAGGAGNSEHLVEGALNPLIDAVATANLFNFIGNALPASRVEMNSRGVNLAHFLQSSRMKSISGIISTENG